MLKGILLKAHPTPKQKEILSQWMGCARYIWNAKCEEDEYLCRFSRRYLPIKTYPTINQKYAQYKSRALSPWLFDCPSQVLRNSASNWFETYRNFLQGRCGKPKRKRKGDTESVCLTRELFNFEKGEDGVIRLRLGTKKRNLGYLSIKNHKKYAEPNSIYIKKCHGQYTVSFCYDVPMRNLKEASKEDLDYLRNTEQKTLEDWTIGIDRGVARPVQAGDKVFDFSEDQKKKKKIKERHIRRSQKRLFKQKKGSKRRQKTKKRISRAHKKIANIRKDFCHKTSREIIDDDKTKVIVLEDLNIAKMTNSKKTFNTKRSRTRKTRATLNRSILDKGWHQLESFLIYKAQEKGKLVFKVSAYHTSQECADCGHTHPSNRKTQERFHCACCGHSDNADRNAAKVIKKRAINLLLDSGTELSKRGVLLDSGRGAANQTSEAIATAARSKEASKKKDKAVKAESGSSSL